MLIQLQGGTAQSLGETYSDPTGDGNLLLLRLMTGLIFSSGLPERAPLDGENEKSSFHGGNETPTYAVLSESNADQTHAFASQNVNAKRSLCPPRELNYWAARSKRCSRNRILECKSTSMYGDVNLAVLSTFRSSSRSSSQCATSDALAALKIPH